MNIEDIILPVLGLAPQEPLYTEVMSDLDEVKSREGIIIAIAIEGDNEIARKTDYVFYLPPVHELLIPVLQVIPLQLSHTILPSEEAVMWISHGTWPKA